MELDGVPRRDVVAGAMLAGGLIGGLWLAATFRWYPYFWQWLAYHSGLVVVVIIYLLASAFAEEVPRKVVRAVARTHPRAGRPTDPRGREGGATPGHVPASRSVGPDAERRATSRRGRIG